MSIFNKESCTQNAIDYIRKKSKGHEIDESYEITINFHPDRFTKDSVDILAAMADEGVYKSQFETSTSNGGLTAYKGGDRWKWEHIAFGGIYDNEDMKHRPKYGALNYLNYSVGASPRFGSCYFRLKEHMLEQTTFCYPDSFFNPKDFSTIDKISQLIELAHRDDKDILDNYIEAHIHGEIIIDRDIDAIVLDPCFKGTYIEDLAKELPCKLEWHDGFELEIGKLLGKETYRGEQYIDLAKKICPNGILKADTIGKEENNYDAQDLKKVWHYLARFGTEY